jgi:hypothetical protein
MQTADDDAICSKRPKLGEEVACNASEQTISFRDVAPALEFACWVVVGLAPLLRWINGAAVTDDQFYIQCTIVVLGIVGAAGLHFYNWRSDQSQRE